MFLALIFDYIDVTYFEMPMIIHVVAVIPTFFGMLALLASSYLSLKRYYDTKDHRFEPNLKWLKPILVVINGTMLNCAVWYFCYNFIEIARGYLNY